MSLLLGRVVHLASDAAHRFSKIDRTELAFEAGRGIVGDAHAGRTVQHLSRIKANPQATNLRQVHLIHNELLDQIAEQGFVVEPGALGENITTVGLDLLRLSRGALLKIGDGVVLEVTGLRNPCAQIEAFCPGLLKTLVDRTPDGEIIRKAGIMAIVVSGGLARLGDTIKIESPLEEVPLEPV